MKFLFLFLFAATHAAYAQTESHETSKPPKIISAEFHDTNSDNEHKKLTISGEHFGDFSGEILSWDDFENHNIGESIVNKRPKDGHTWTSIYDYRGRGIKIDEKYKVSGEQSLMLDWSIDTNGIRAFGWAGKGPYNQLYITYWRRMTGDFNFSKSNHKQFYLYGSKGGFPQLMPLIPAGTKTWGLYNNVGDESVTYLSRNNINTSGWDWDNTSEKFQRWEFFVKLNSPYTESNGVVEAWLNGNKGISNKNYRISYVDGQFTDFRLGHMAGGFSSSAKAWFDDIYIATTQARVEICETAEYKDCTKKHIQYIPSKNWVSDATKINSIEFRPRGFELLKGNNIYVYVINKDGIASKGFKLNLPKPPIAQL